MKKKLAFVIITPSYNQGHFIAQTLDSVASQAKLEQHLVLDGGSIDDTVGILKKYTSPKLWWRSKKDHGQADAINQGLQQAIKNIAAKKSLKNEVVVAYLNSDDYYLDGTFNQVAEAFAAQPQAQWLVGDAVIVDEQGKEIQKVIRAYKQWWRRFLSWPVLGILNPIPQPAVFIKLSAVESVGLFNPDLHYVMDYEYWLRLFKACGQPILLHQPLAAFRIHAAAKGGTGFAAQFKEQFTITKQYFKNPLVLWLQRAHNLLVVSVYKLIK